ncbi:hypothetical protein DJ523_07565 [Sulfolobus sp. E5]|nr:hypothetical protein DJ523_07565 [Sulfolobus sp. E5]
MDIIYLTLVTFLASWIIIYLLKDKLKKYNITVYPFFIMWRKKSREYWFPRVSKSKIYKIYERISMFLGFILMIGGM